MIHLPNGQVMMTFVDVTDSVNVERALKDKNEALQKSDQLKNDFVQHVSYELRSPLTNIIGFTELLPLPATGPLTPAPARICRSYRLVVLGAAHHRQRHSRPRHGRCRHHGARHRRGRRRPTPRRPPPNWWPTGCASTRSRCEVDAARAPKSFSGDEHRVRQVLFNLLSNAANYAPDAQHDRRWPARRPRARCRVLRARRRSGHAAGGARHGVPPLRIARQWRPPARRRAGPVDRQELRRAARRHRSASTPPGTGTTVICRFPLVPLGVQDAAE